MRKKISRFLFVQFLMLWAVFVFGQSMELMIKQADGFFKSKQYFRAAPLYLQISARYPQDQLILLKRAISDYETNNLDSATAIVHRLMGGAKAETN